MDARRLAEGVSRHLERLHRLQPLVNPSVDTSGLAVVFTQMCGDIWVDDSGGSLHGHLSARLLDDDNSGEIGAFSGPDAVSFESTGVLARLVDHAHSTWLSRGARFHSVWSPLEEFRAWTSLGYEPTALSLEREWGTWTSSQSPEGVTVRVARTDDLLALQDLDAEIDRAHHDAVDPSSRTRLVDLVEDPEVTYLVAEHEHRVIGQIAAWSLGALVGYFPETLHLSDLAVAPPFRRRGVAALLIREVVRQHSEDTRVVETRSRVINSGASALWANLGFETAFVRLERTLR